MKKDIISVSASAGAMILSFAPFNLYFLAWFGLVPLFMASEGRNKRGVIIIHMLWGILFFTGTTYWVTHSMYYYGNVPIYFGLIILGLLVLYLSIYIILFGLGYYLVKNQKPIIKIFAVSSLWVAVEYLRGSLFTGFPWSLLGYSQTSFLTIIQIADISGVWGVSFIIVISNAVISLIIGAALKKDAIPAKEIISLAVILLSVVIYGTFRRGQIERSIKNWDGIKVGIAQGGIGQSIKWDRAYQKETIRKYRDLSLMLHREGSELILWPETAVPFFLQSNKEIGPTVLKIAKDTRCYIIAGSPAYDKNNQKISYYNSAFLISPEGSIKGRYDKVHLVPFGEYVPLKKLLFFIGKLTEGIGDFTPGRQLKPLFIKISSVHHPKSALEHGIGIMICFESIFPELARRLVTNGANILAVMTNDAWFGRTSAPYQHFDMAIFRAVENRIFLIRAANTGISGIIDPTGKVIARSGLFTTEAIAKRVGFRNGHPTLYTKYGEFFIFACLIFSLSIIVGTLIRRYKIKVP